MSVYQKRLKKLFSSLREVNLEAIFVQHLPHVRYLSGFSGSHGYLLIVKDSSFFFTDSRYAQSSQKEVEASDIFILEKNLFLTVKEKNILATLSAVGFEKQFTTVDKFEQMTKIFPNLQWKSCGALIEKLSAIKDEEEISLLKKAVSITDRVFDALLPDLKVGVSEKAISAKISYLMMMNGADGDSYDPIVASGPNSALPHAHPTDRCFEKGDVVLMDFGALYKGYHADMTRTVFLENVSQRQKDIYELVYQSQTKGISVAKSGVLCREVDRACRSVFEDFGYTKEFCHATGHGLGLGVHTYPAVSQGSDVILYENFVITVEPGLYFPEDFGVRIEDDCLIRLNNCDILNRSSKKLIIL